MRKRIKNIFDVNVTNINFGIRKQVIAEVANREDLIKFIELVKAKDMLFLRVATTSKTSGHFSYVPRPSYKELAPLDSQMRALRKLWRNAYTDSFSEGLYTCTGALDWQVGACAGELGTAWINNRVERGTLFMYVQHDRLGNVELADAKTSRVIKLNRGSSVCDRFIKMNEGEKDE